MKGPQLWESLSLNHKVCGECVCRVIFLTYNVGLRGVIEIHIACCSTYNFFFVFTSFMALVCLSCVRGYLIVLVNIICSTSISGDI